jgi:hypothetical protein
MKAGAFAPIRGFLVPVVSQVARGSGASWFISSAGFQRCFGLQGILQYCVPRE